ncbi:MAG: helix-turn-helix domain-containing protein [Cellulosilyticaceae bacterium]
MELKFKDFCKDESQIYMADLVLRENDNTEGHCHDFYEFFVVLEGEFVHYYNDKVYILKKGMGHFMAPDTFHKLAVGEGIAVSRLRNIAIHKTYFEEIVVPLGDTIGQALWEPVVLRQEEFEQFQYKTDKIIRYYEERISAYVVESIMMDLLVHMVYERESHKEEPKWLIEACKTLEREQFVGGLTRLLELCGKTQEHVTRTFVRYYQLTPTGYINDQKLAWSCGLLVTTKQPIIDIAYTCGFNTIAYYNKLFKAKYQCSPTQYRQRHARTFY